MYPAAMTHNAYVNAVALNKYIINQNASAPLHLHFVVGSFRFSKVYSGRKIPCTYTLKAEFAYSFTPQ